MAQIRILGMFAPWPWPWSYDLGSRHDPSLSHGQQLCEILSRSNMTVKSYGPDIDFVYKCTVTLALEIWPWVKVMTHPWVMDNNCVKFYPDPTWQWRVMARTHLFCYVCTLTLTLEVWPWVKVMTHPWVMDNNCVKYYPDPTWHSEELWPGHTYFAVCTLTLTLEDWPWIKVITHPWVIGSRSLHILGSWTTIVCNIIQIEHGSEELWPRHGFWVCVHCDLDLGVMTSGQGHDTFLGHGQ